MSFFSSSSKDPAQRRRRIVLAWAIVVIWAAVIWTLGGDGFSAGETSGWFSDFMRSFGIEFTRAQKLKLTLLIRKSAHLVEYGILAILTFRAALISAGRNQIATAGWTALFLVALLATADEARQAFLPSRTGSPVDVMIDVAGGTLAIAGLIFLMRRVRESSPPLQESQP